MQQDKQMRSNQFHHAAHNANAHGRMTSSIRSPGCIYLDRLNIKLAGRQLLTNCLNVENGAPSPPPLTTSSKKQKNWISGSSPLMSPIYFLEKIIDAIIVPKEKIKN